MNYANAQVLHKSTGERLVLLGVNPERREVCAAGWPATIARLDDCEVEREGSGLTETEQSYRVKTFGNMFVDEYTCE